MKKSEMKKAGADILLVNIILILFLLSEEQNLLNCILTSASAGIALALNIYVIMKHKSKGNLIACFLNGILLFIILGYTIVTFLI